MPSLPDDDINALEAIVEQHLRDCKKIVREGSREVAQISSDLERLQFKTLQQNNHFRNEMSDEIQNLSQ